MHGDDYKPALQRLRHLLYDRPQLARRLLADDPAIRAFEDSDDGQRALQVLMAYVQLLAAVRDSDDSRVREIQEQLPAETFDQLIALARAP
jgi:hypothetical protein